MALCSVSEKQGSFQSASMGTIPFCSAANRLARLATRSTWDERGSYQKVACASMPVPPTTKAVDFSCSIARKETHPLTSD